MRNAFSCALLYRIRGLAMTDRGPLQSSWPGLDLASRTWNHPPMSLSMFLRSVWIMNRYCPDQSLKWMVATRDIPLYSYSMHLIGIQSNLYRSVMRFARKHEDIAMFKKDQAVYKAVKDTPAWWTIYIHFPQTFTNTSTSVKAMASIKFECPILREPNIVGYWNFEWFILPGSLK